ncbi:uncharacterized protein PAC_03608 [Phialocephala subalpina]|uniref:C2H2-type domain-containing protein n=1 Tax=Phialocephala subalpina TaxID=576137 RepID=A0A1L7WLS9_9HELO|nr:uncharacterized protein PAC_03608 [Phialocephala subalpina]
MESFCHHCGFWFPTSTAQDAHSHHTSNPPQWLPKAMFIDPSIQIVLEAPWQSVMDPSPASSPSTIEAPWKFVMDSSPPSSPFAEDATWNTMDFSPLPSPDLLPQWVPEAMFTQSPAPVAAEAPWKFTMDSSLQSSPVMPPWSLIKDLIPSPPPAPILESFPEFPNPFMNTHPLSPRILTFPAPNMTIPVVPTIGNWANHLLKTGCSRFGKGCFGNCIPGAEELQNSSRFPLAPGFDEFRNKRKATDNGDAPRKRLRILRPREVPVERVIRNMPHANGKTSCWICNGMFFRIASHLKTHEKECKWKCDGCQETFPRKWILTRHLSHGRPWCL